MGILRGGRRYVIDFGCHQIHIMRHRIKCHRARAAHRPDILLDPKIAILIDTDNRQRSIAVGAESTSCFQIECGRITAAFNRKRCDDRTGIGLNDGHPLVTTTDKQDCAYRIDRQSGGFFAGR